MQWRLGCMDHSHCLGACHAIKRRTDNVCGEQLFIGKRPQIAGKVEHQNCQQHQHAAQQRVEEKFDGRILATRATPDTDQKIHRQQHHFPENVEKEKVECDKNAQHARFQQ